MVAVTVLSLVGGFVGNQRLEAMHVHPHEKLNKESDIALADLIVKTNARTFAQFDCESLGPKLEAFFKKRVICDEVIKAFTIHEAYFKGFFGKETAPEEMAKESFMIIKDVDLVAVFSDPADALKPGVFNNPYSRTVSKIVSERVPKDPDFTFLSTVDGPYGKLSVYRNSRQVVEQR